MSNQAVDTQNKGDADVVPVVQEIELDLAFIGLIQSYVEVIDRANTLLDARVACNRLMAKLEGEKNKLRGELMRLRQPDS